VTGLWRGDVAGMGAMRMPTHEEFFVRASASGGWTLEPGQLEGVRVAFDGQAPPPGSRLFAFDGPPPPDALDVLVMPAGVRSGKSLVFGACKSVYQACTVDVRGIAKAREDIVCSFFAPKQSKAVETLAMALGIFETFAPWMIVGKVSSDKVPDEFWVRSPFGPLLHFCAFGFDAGGLNARGRWHLNSVFEEFAFAKGEGYKFNDADLYDAVINRLAPGGRGKLQVISSTWAKSGKLWQLADQNYESPGSAVVLKGATDALRTNADVLGKMAKARVEYERRGELEIFDREWGALFLGLGSRHVYDDETVKAACPWRDGTDVDRTLRPGDMVVAGADLAFSGDHAALVIVRVRVVPTPGLVREDDARGGFRMVPGTVNVRHYAVLYVEELAPPRNGVLMPGETLRGFAATMRRFGVRFVMADGHYIASIHEALRGTGIVVTPTSKRPDEVHMHARTAMRDRRVALLNDERLLHQLTLVTRRPAGAGRWTIDIPRGLAGTGGAGGHGDVAVAYATALMQGHGAVVQAPPPVHGTAEWYAAEAKRDKEEFFKGSKRSNSAW
jgi:hypothetical protein